MEVLRIMITGKRQRGKDTLADCIDKELPNRPIRRLGFAVALKTDLRTILSAYHGVPHTPIEYLDRKLYGPLWQAYGEWCRQYFGSDYWISRLDVQEIGYGPVVITDCRYFNEVKYGKAHGYTIVRVEGPYRGSADDKRDDNHPSERDILSLPVDLVYNNTGTIDDMRRWAREVLLCDFVKGTATAQAAG